ncbi:MAG TPA: hypothetical protein VKT82_34135 [Ktedonobacterales bacterium]|nr:hypothetical protein [Ktedonobacterales bacterium]
MALDSHFSSSERSDYEALLEEAIDTILTANLELGPNERQPDDSLEALVKPLRRLKESRAFFASALDVRHLGRHNFPVSGLQPSLDIQELMDTHDFYLIRIPVTLSPAFGWGFIRLACDVDFACTGPVSAPMTYDIFPDNAWTEILHMQTHLTLGLDEGLGFRAELQPIEAAYQPLSGAAQAKLALEASGGIRLVVGPFSYRVARATVLATGRGNSIVSWKLAGYDVVQREEPSLAVVLRVPKGFQEIRARGWLAAYHKFDFLGSNLTDWAGRFSEKVRSFFSNGLPIEDAKIWNNITA